MHDTSSKCTPKSSKVHNFTNVVKLFIQEGESCSEEASGIPPAPFSLARTPAMISLFNKLVANGASLICGMVWRRMYVCLTEDRVGTLSLDAGGSPGIPNDNQSPSSGPYGPKQHWSSDEPLFRAIKRIIRTRRHSGGVLLRALCTRSACPIGPPLSFHYVNREVADQRQRIKTGHLPRDTWNRCAPGGPQILPSRPF
jgi:hypothetical protein